MSKGLYTGSKNVLRVEIDNVSIKFLDELKLLLLDNGLCFEEEQWGKRQWHNRIKRLGAKV